METRRWQFKSYPRPKVGTLRFQSTLQQGATALSAPGATESVVAAHVIYMYVKMYSVQM